MPNIDQTQFEALWQTVQNKPLVTPAPAATPVQLDLSLTGMLTQYMTMATTAKNQGKISAQDYNDLQTAVNALKAILARINESPLVAAAVAQNAAAIQQKKAPSTN